VLGHVLLLQSHMLLHLQGHLMLLLGHLLGHPLLNRG
jgi:hypothetical protein